MTIGLIGVFLAGLGTFLTPCVLPLIPVYLTSLLGGDVTRLDQAGRGQLFWRALLFSLGFIAVFTAMGLGASSLGTFLSDHRGALMMLGAALVLVFALKFLGLLSLPFLDRVVRADDAKLKTRFAGLNAFAMGVVFAAGWSPCVGPVLGSVLTYTASQASSAWMGAGYLFVYGLGFAVPLLLTAIFAGSALKLLGRASKHLPRIERAIGAALLLVAFTLGYDAVERWRADADMASRGSVASGSDARVGKETESMPRMLELYTEDCPVCQAMKPTVEGIVNQCDSKGVRVETFDVSKPEHRALARRYRVVGVPTFLFIDSDGREVARLVGEQTEQTLYQGLAALRGERCPGIGLLEDFDAKETGIAEKKTKLAFPEQKQEVVSCRSTDSSASAVKSASRLSEKPEPQTEFDALAVEPSAESCSQQML